MSDVTTADVVKNLSGLTLELSALVASLKASDLDATKKRHAADLAESKAFLAATGSVDARKHTAKVETEQQEFDALVAESLVRGLRAQIRAVETRIDAGRSFGAALRAELKTIGLEGTP